MWQWFRQARNGARKQQQFSLLLERLEGRDCPAAPTLSFSVVPVTGTEVQVSGSVQDSNPQTVEVDFSGVVSGSVSPDADGNFSLLAQASGLGTVTGQATDQDNLTSDLVQEELTAASPSLTLNAMIQEGQTVTVSGQVSDADLETCSVSFSGVVSGSAGVNPDGTFSLTTTASGSGTIDATVVNVWGLTGTAETSLDGITGTQTESQDTNLLPGLTVTVTPTGSGKSVTVSGQVSDSNPANLTVTFSGVVSGSAVTDSNGNFSLTTTATDLGEVDASVTDGAGQSASASTQLAVAPPTLTLNLTMDQQRTITLSGQVSGSDVTEDMVTFTGVASGSAGPGTNGSFSLTTQASQLGDVQAVVTDVWGQASALAKVTVACPPPTIDNLEIVCQNQSNNYWTASGTVSSQSAGGLTVNFSGTPSFNNASAPVQTTGEFALEIELGPQDAGGTVTATVEDWWGQAGEATFYL